VQAAGAAHAGADDRTECEMRMNRMLEKTLVGLLLLDAISQIGFWTAFLIKPPEPITPFLTTHIPAEYFSALMALVTFILSLRRSRLFKPVMLFTVGVMFYASMQAIGWAVDKRAYPALASFLLNLSLIAVYVGRELRQAARS
jgi:hypothetical protein